MNINLASIHLADATRLASRAAGKEAMDPKFSCWELEDLIKAMTNAADAIGFDLVKREAPAARQEAA